MTRRLNPIDADMLYAELPTWHLHVGGVILVDPSAAPGGLSFEKWKAALAAHLDRVEPLRRRVVPVPLGLDRPLWVHDRTLDIDRHVRHVEVRAPGGRHQLAEVVSEFAGRKLDRSRPLWEMWYADGLDDGGVAILAKVHHAVADGVAASLLLGEFLTTQPDTVVTRPFPTPDQPEPVPSRLALLVSGLASLVGSPLRAVRPFRHTVSSVGEVVSIRRSRASTGAAAPFSGPRTSFNRPVTALRSFAFTRVPLADVKEIKNELQMTVNDVVLSLCAGAVRKHLQARHELPDTPLVAAVPVSTRTTEQAGEYGNRVSGLFVTLPTHIADPIERLHALRGAAEDAKRMYVSGAEDVLIEWADVPPPLAMAIGTRLFTRMRLAERIPPIFNLLVSNVPGSPVPLYLGGAPVTAVYPLGPVLDDVGLNVTILSHVDQIHFGLVSCPELMPDLWNLADRIPDALEELLSACR